MNLEQAIRNFVRDKFEFLLSKNFTQQRMRQEFQTRHAEKHRRLTSKDLVIPLVNLLKERNVPAPNIKQYLETLPIFRDIGSGLIAELKQIADERDYSSGLKDEDLELIKKLNAIEAAKELGTVKFEIERSKTLEELNRKIAEAQSEYDSLPSVLDYEEISEPDFDPKNEDVKQWWERFYLRENPFPQQDGLSQINEELYEEVLVKTKPFQDCLGSLKVDRNYLFDRGILLCGDSGFGKTTFVDYLSYHLIRYDFLPIRITPDQTYSDSAGFLTGFYLQLRDRLKREFRKMSDDPVSLPQLRPRINRDFGFLD